MKAGNTSSGQMSTTFTGNYTLRINGYCASSIGPGTK